MSSMTKKLIFSGLSAVLGLTLACGPDDLISFDGISINWKEIDKSYELPDYCYRVEDAQIGQEGLQVSVSDLVVTVQSWIPKDDNPNEFVGFTYTFSGDDVLVLVKAGQDVFAAQGTGNWIHPGGTSGNEVKGIGPIVFCDANP